MTVTEKYLNALKEDEKLREYASKNVPAQGTDKENALVAVANQFGYQITKEELLETLNARRTQIEQSRSNAHQAVSELSEAALMAVNGGVCDSNYYVKCSDEQRHEWCEDTFQAGEWCWSTDSCDKVFTCYGDWAVM